MNVNEYAEPIRGEITVTCEPGFTMTERALDEQLSNNKFSTTAEISRERRCYYTSVPRVIKRKGIDAEKLTALNLDKASAVTFCFYLILKDEIVITLLLLFRLRCLTLYSDRAIGTSIDEGVWRLRRLAPWRAAICIYSFYGT